jgi:ABC-type branched-subunit amino acid transport system permease subunit
MKPIQKKKITGSIAKVCIWTIRQHEYLVSQIRVYIWFASATVLLLSLAGIISLAMALFALLFGALAVAILLWLLNEVRRSFLLKLDDPVLKKKAHETMLTFIHARRHKLNISNEIYDRKWHDSGSKPLS